LPRAETLQDFLNVKKIKKLKPAKKEVIDKPKQVPQMGMSLKAVQK
tara:strand:+ start:284 stop:421 length:138 start_codon:yes stop_codon:yes gene_type:complete